jgi:hypothetical protein
LYGYCPITCLTSQSTLNMIFFFNEQEKKSLQFINMLSSVSVNIDAGERVSNMD